MPAPYTGGCQCGSVRFVLTTEPIRLGACHCRECQRQSGSAFGMFMRCRREFGWNFCGASLRRTEDI
jgi:hypothetical protein